LKSHAGGSTATGRFTQAGKVKNDFPEKETRHRPPLRIKFVEKTIQSNTQSDGRLDTHLGHKYDWNKNRQAMARDRRELCTGSQSLKRSFAATELLGSRVQIPLRA
jgi:hypothetical protein